MFPKIHFLLLLFVVMSSMLPVSLSWANPWNPEFNGFQNAECFAPYYDTTCFYLKIYNGSPGQSVRVVWTLRPFSDHKQNSATFNLDEFGTKDTTWKVTVFPHPESGDCDHLMLIPLDPAGNITIDSGQWIIDKGNNGRVDGPCEPPEPPIPTGQSLPTLSEWGLIVLVFMILAAAIIIFYQRKPNFK